MIATLEEIKSLLGIEAADTSLDVKLTAQMLPVQSYILKKCRTSFASNYLRHISSTIVFDASGKTITDASGGFIDLSKLGSASDVAVTYSLYNNKNFTTSDVSDTVITVDEVVIDENSNNEYEVIIRAVLYPEGLKNIFASMCYSKLNPTLGTAIKSKKLEEFTVTYATENKVDGFNQTDILALNEYRVLG